MTIKENLALLRKEIGGTAEKFRRKPESITLVGVTKHRNMSEIKEAVACGVEDVGENKAQELEEKYPDLKELGVGIHFIGRLQSNKVKKVVEMTDYIHSVDSIDLLRKIQYRAMELDKKQNIFLQVNTSGEEQKQGMAPEEVEYMMTAMKQLPFDNVRFIGLMTMAPHTEEKEIIRNCFSELRDLGEELSISHLSMGMTNDYKIAIEEGATVLRIGRKIFE